MEKQSGVRQIILFILIVFLAAGNVILGVNYIRNRRTVALFQHQMEQNERNARLVAFLKLFVSKILKSEGEVSFEDRLKMENDVRGLNDAEVLNRWRAFVDSANEKEAQQNLRQFLQALAERIKV